MGAINIASWGFGIGAGGQMAFYWLLFPGVPRWIPAALVFVPWLTVFTISFCNRLHNFRFLIDRDTGDLFISDTQL